jgi:hypothetical protein
MHKKEKRLTQDARAILEGMEHAGADGACVGVQRRSQGGRSRCSRGLTGGETGQGRAGLGSAPNQGLELTASSVRCAPAFGSSSRLVRRQRREGKNSKDDLFMQEEMPA